MNLFHTVYSVHKCSIHHITSTQTLMDSYHFMCSVWSRNLCNIKITRQTAAVIH